MKNSTSGGTSADADALSQAKNQFSFLNRHLMAWVERQLTLSAMHLNVQMRSLGFVPSKISGI
jgi:hypothetical protein